MSEMLLDYKKYKDRVLGMYDEILNKNILPVEAQNRRYDVDFINKQKKNLENELFYVSFCGQIKTGKSTLVNAILFQDNVLPTDDVPTTATLNIIKYGETPKVVAHFYTRKEWNRIKQSPRYKDDIEPYVEKSIKKGININDIIKDTTVSKEFGIHELVKLVSAQGEYTPFVKEVEITYPSEILKDLLVVDTPGTNDPNEVRSERTLKWVKESNAVVYLFYAGKPLSVDDLEFIDKYLVHVHGDDIIFAINKIDMIDESSISAIKTYVETNLRNNKKLKDRKLLEGKKIYLVSSLAALIRQLKNKGMELDEDLEFFEEQIPDEILQNEGYIDELKQAISTRLLKNKGIRVVESHLNTVREVVSLKILKEKEELSQTKERLQAAQKSQREREKDKEEIKSILEHLEKEQKKVKNKLDKEVKEFRNKMFGSFINAKDHVISDITGFIQGQTDIGNLRSVLGYRTKRDIEMALRDIMDVDYNSAITKLTQEIENSLDDLKRRMGNKYDLEDEIDLIYKTFSIREVLKGVDFSALSIENLKKHTKKFLFWTRKGATKEEYVSIAIGTIPNIFESIENQVIGEVRQRIDENWRIIIGKIEEYLKDLQRNIQEVEKELRRGKINIKKIKQEIEDRKNKLEMLKSWQGKVEAEIEEVKNSIKNAAEM